MSELPRQLGCLTLFNPFNPSLATRRITQLQSHFQMLTRSWKPTTGNVLQPRCDCLTVVPQALLISGDAETVGCQDFAPTGAAWLTSNAEDLVLYQTCVNGG